MLRKWKQMLHSGYFVRLLWMVLLSIIAALVVFAAVIYTSYGTLYLSSLSSRGQTTAAEICGGLESALMDYSTAVDELAAGRLTRQWLTQSPPEDGGLSLLRQMYGYKNDFTEEAAISVISLKTGDVLSTGSSSLAPGETDSLNWSVFRQANETDGVAVHLTAKDAVLEDTTRLALAKVVCGADGQKLGYVLLEAPRTTLAALYHMPSTGYASETLLLNPYDTVIYSSAGAEAEGLGKLPNGKSTEQAWSGSRSGTLWGGAYAYCRSDLLRGLILVELPKMQILNFRSSLLGALLLGLATAALVSVLVAWRVAQTISRPVHQLRASMEKFRNGELDTRVPVQRSDEMGQLEADFNLMTEQIEQLVGHVQQEQESLRVAEAQALSLQVNPHFIYNVLDLIGWCARLGKNDVVVQVTVNFGKLLRSILNNRDDMVCVRTEMDMVRAYIDIQKLRYAERLQVEMQLDESLEEERIPKLLIQPLVENALVHGLEGKPGVGRIRISSRREDGYLVFLVEDNGVGLSEERLEHVRQFKSQGMYNIGLSNVQQRAQLYGDERCGLRIESKLGEGTKVWLTVLPQPETEKRKEDDDVPGASGGG